MAEFLNAYKRTSKHEGGYADHPNDRGGETYMGISRKYHPKWKGWAILDKYKPLKRNQKIKDDNLESEVKQFYYYNFWLPMAGDYLEHQTVADFIYDWHVNSGKSGLKAVQRALGLKDDGVIGSVSIKAINKAKIEDLKAARVKFFQSIVNKDPSQKVFLKGWLNRVDDY